MATTPQGTARTEQHRRDQVAIAAAFLAEFLAMWNLLDPRRLAATRVGWLTAVMRLIETYRMSSAREAQEYYADFRGLELSGDLEPLPDITYLDTARAENAARRVARSGAPDVHRSAPLPRQQVGLTRNPDRQQGLVIDWGKHRPAVQTSLEVTGPIGIKSRMREGMTDQQIDQAARHALVESSGAATRHVLDGGRQTELTLMQADTRLLGYIRVTDADPCYFCAMLASRGPVYFQRVSGVHSFSRSDPRFEGSGSFKAHDHCACTMESVYSTDTQWPGLGKDLQTLWNATIRRKYSGKEAIRQWQKTYRQWAKQRDIDQIDAA